MNTRSKFQFSTLMIIMAITSALFADGVYFESQFTNSRMSSQESRLTQTYLMPKMMKSVTTNGTSITIIRIDQEKMIKIDTKAKTYWEMTFTEMENAMKNASAKMDAQRAQMQERMKNMPDEQRKIMEQQMGAMMGTSDSVVNMVATSDKKQISGFNCVKYEAKQSDRIVATIWATKDFKSFENLRKDYQALSQRILSLNPQMAKGLGQAMSKIEGFPIETDFGEMTKNIVTKVESHETALSEFTIPAGLTKVESPLMKMSK